MTEPVLLTENDIYERMVATILDHRLPPGTKLVEDRLATAFGVSMSHLLSHTERIAMSNNANTFELTSIAC